MGEVQDSNEHVSSQFQVLVEFLLNECKLEKEGERKLVFQTAMRTLCNVVSHLLQFKKYIIQFSFPRVKTQTLSFTQNFYLYSRTSKSCRDNAIINRYLMFPQTPNTFVIGDFDMFVIYIPSCFQR